MKKFSEVFKEGESETWTTNLRCIDAIQIYLAFLPSVCFSRAVSDLFLKWKKAVLSKTKIFHPRVIFSTSTFRLRHKRHTTSSLFFLLLLLQERVARRTKFDSDALIALNNIRSVRSLFLGARNLILRPHRPLFWKVATAFFEAAHKVGGNFCSAKRRPKRIHFYARRVRAHRRR